MKRLLSLIMALCILCCTVIPAMAMEAAAAPEPLAEMYHTQIKVSVLDRNGGSLAGGVFHIYRAGDDAFMEEIVSDGNGVALSGQLPADADYYMLEMTAPIGYQWLCRYFTLKTIDFCANTRTDLTVRYSPIEGQVKVIKSGDDGQRLSGVTFRIYDAESDTLRGTLTTGADGTAQSGTLSYGAYYLTEQETVPGYALLEEPIPFSILEHGAAVELPVINSKIMGSVSMLKVNGEAKPLPDAVFGLYTEQGQKLAELTTLEDGSASYSGLPLGGYYLRELKAPEGYLLNGEALSFTIEQQGQIAEITVTNQRLPEPEKPEPEQKTGTVKLLKVDAADGKTLLSGAVFGVYETEGGAKVGELLTGKDGTAALTLPEGSYTLRELTAPEGYQLSGESISLRLNAGETRELTVKNSKSQSEKPEPPTPAKPSTLKLVKVDSDDGKKLSGAVFGVFNADTDRQIDTLTTNKNGTAELSLPAGDYYLRELEAPDGYTLKQTDINFHLESGAARELTVQNTREDEPEKLGILELTKEDKDTGKALRGAVFAVYTKDNEKIDEVTTGRDGIVELELPVGSYYLRELEAPRGYQLDRGKVSFKITEDKTTHLIVENTKEKADTVKPEQPKPETPKPEQPMPTPSQPDTSKPAPSQPDTSKPSPSKPAPSVPNGKVRLLKQAAGSGAPLPGAVFGVYTQSGEKLAELTSGADGAASISLPAGRYLLKELRAPYGYKPENARIRVDVLESKTTLVEVTNELDPNAPPLPEINVPQTGIPFPTASYTLSALLFGIVALCGMALIRTRKRAQ